MEAGALMIKLFPAQLWTPDAFKALRAVGRFGEVALLPSGGFRVVPAQARVGEGRVPTPGRACKAPLPPSLSHRSAPTHPHTHNHPARLPFLLRPGGVSPDTLFKWLDAGAACVGMGSCLVGDDVRVAPTADPAALAAAVKKWADGGRAAVETMYAKLKTYTK